MKPTVRVSVSLWTLLVFSALIKNARAECVTNCETETLPTTTTTTIIFGSEPNCTVTIGNNIYENSPITDLIPGAVYQIVFNCLNCCKEVTTKPEQVINLTATATTNSISLNWTKPEGNSSFYTVQWTDGNVTKSDNATQTYMNITNLTAGVRYGITVAAVADDHLTEGAGAALSLYTKPGKIEKLDVLSASTSSISLNWTSPGQVFKYKVEWHNGGSPAITFTSVTSAMLSGLIPGTKYTIAVTAVAGDNKTEGEPQTIHSFTKPEAIRGLTVTNFTTSTVSLEWTEPEGNSSFYIVKWTGGNLNENRSVTSTLITVSQLMAGVQYNFSVTAAAGDEENIGEVETVSQYTRPAAVRNLSVTEVTTSSVTLNWTNPEGNADWYEIQWNAGEEASSNTTTETSFTIKDVMPGSQYNITVAAAAVKLSNKGKETLITTFTRPEKPGNIMVTARGTDNLSFNWTLPEGKADHFMVNISNTNLTYLNVSKTEVTAAQFTHLYPGRVFVITVTAVAGNFNNVSDQSSFATVPTPPGSIIVSQRTNSSLQLKWTAPAMMEGAPDISYHVTYQPKGGEIRSKDSTDDNTELPLLLSGTSYNITVETVGPQNLRSTLVHYSTFTLPNPVLNLVVYPTSTTSVKVKWSDPLGAQPYYQYSVQAYNATGALVNFTTVNDSSTDVSNLEPGSRYNISVRTIAAPGSESTVEQAFSYTMPKAVTDLTVEDVNTTAVQLTWLRQSDHKPSYSYLVIALRDGMVVQSNSTETETYTFHHLVPGQLYTFQVFTVVEDVKSTVESVQSSTRPEAVSNFIVIGSTTNLSVSWAPVSGQVSSYSVLLYRDTQLVENDTDLSSDTRNKLFVGLKPGVLYCVVLVTKSGNVESNGSQVCNATFPNPPGPITVESQTVESINFTWPVPEDMDHNQYKFSVSGTLTVNNWFLLDNLQSGSPSSISVVTVGVLMYESTAVTAENYTRPYPVTNLTQTEITTSTVTLLWEQRDSKLGYSYEVQVTNGSEMILPNVVSENTTATITGLQSGSNFSFAVTTRTADDTRADPVTVSYFTRPYGIRGLEAKTLNTTAVHLLWMKPLEYRNYYTYWVKTTGCASQNKSLAEESAAISELTPGTNCTFCVSVIAADVIEGEENCVSQYTKPETVQPSISSQGSNSSVLVSWTKPNGNVEYYEVYLNNTSPGLNKSVQLNSTTTSFLFEGLSAGRLYSAMLITYSGPFSAPSELITNATFPNPPGPIEILMKTTRSIEFRWTEAPQMTGASFFYQLTNTPAQGGGNINTSTTTITSHTFDSLLSGTSFNISVATVGALGFESETVHSNMVTTRPMSVQFLTAPAEETSVTVIWTRPGEYKDSYRYKLTWQSSDEAISNSTILNETQHTISNLDPGRRYNFSVTTETSDGTPGAPVWTSNCTNASPVKNLTCQGPNEANAEVVLSWVKPNGQHSGFRVTVDDGEIENGACCNHTVSNLRHNTEYKLTVETLSCGQPSTPVSLRCRTGITNPPIPPAFVSKVVLTHKAHNQFTLQIDTSLLNSSNGPITHVGVLVTSSVPDDTSDLTKYLGRTYGEWKAKKTPVYLATVALTDGILQSRSSQDHLNVVVGNESKWNGYFNGALDANGKYQWAIAIFTDLILQEDLVDSTKSLVSITSFAFDVQLPNDPAIIGIAVGATLGIFCILFIILIGFIIYWKRISNKESSDIQIHSMRAKVSIAVRMEEYEAYYKKQKADSNCGFAEEFEDLKVVGTSQSKIHALTLENKSKNRYNNVLPYDSSRVKLSIIHGNPNDDYINANYMPGYSSRKEFIAAQGPLPATVNEFWRMIWEKNVQTLVMLTRCNEQGRVKCEQYWSSGTKHCENITVTTTSEIPLGDWTIRDFDIKNVKTAETRSVRHFHFTAWPDHGVPETTELLISFRHLVREHMNQYSKHSPTVVHCSAGVGRTGTFIAIDRLIFQIERENIVDVYGIVHDLRMHRPLMVQTEDQYVFLNQCALDIIRSRTGTNVDLIYQNTAALSIYENVEPKKGFPKNGYHNA